MDKQKISLKELHDIYDIEDDSKHIPEKKQTNANSEFEIYTDEYDKLEEEKDG